MRGLAGWIGVLLLGLWMAHPLPGEQRQPPYEQPRYSVHGTVQYVDPELRSLTVISRSGAVTLYTVDRELVSPALLRRLQPGDVVWMELRIRHERWIVVELRLLRRPHDWT